jgi:CheW-like domain
MRFVVGFDESRQYVDSVASLTRIPRSPGWLLGAFTADGNAVPLVDVSAWAHQTEPAGWRSQGPLPGAGFDGYLSQAPSSEPLRALRMGDGPNAWAIRVSQAPSVVSLSQDQSRAISSRLPLAVSSVSGHLMPHASVAWFLPENVIALQIRWTALAEILRQELAGIATAGRRKQ